MSLKWIKRDRRKEQIDSFQLKKPGNKIKFNALPDLYIFTTSIIT